MSKKRLLMLFTVVALVILVAVGSWIAGSSIQSPAEAAARTAPPTPSAILVPVEDRPLSSVIVTRGTARFGLPQALSIVPSVLKADAGVITTLPARNTQLSEGDVILTASGRPVFILQGKIPTFRDLGPGVVGDDVRQLEEALQRLGFALDPADGVYDEQTSAAVAAWYKAEGWEPFGPTAEQLDKIRSLTQELATARNDSEAAADAAAVTPLAVEAARANADSANKLAAAEVTAKTAVRDQLAADSNTPANELVNANTELEAAQLAQRAIQLEGEVAVKEALNAQKVAEREVNLTNNLVIQLESELALARSRSGVHLPADEIIFMTSVPVRIEQIEVGVGDAASGPVLTVTNNQLAIDSSLPLNQAALVQPGVAVTIDEPELGIEAKGVVVRVAKAPGTDGVDGFHIYFETRVDQAPADTTLEGFSLRLTIPVKSTSGAVMVVPLSALSLAADGSSRVQVSNNGALEYVVVEPGLAADGFVEVTPVNGTLAPGQLVVIGYENPS